jgi:hypothetical protein
MRIARRTEIHGSLLPAASCAISAIPPEYLHHERHQLLHPQSAYGTSIRLLTAQWTKTLDDLSVLRTRYFANQDDMFLMDVATSYSALLHKLNEHFDACYSVLRSLSPTVETKPGILHSQHLERVSLLDGSSSGTPHARTVSPTSGLSSTHSNTPKVSCARSTFTRAASSGPDTSCAACFPAGFEAQIQGSIVEATLPSRSAATCSSIYGGCTELLTS